MARLSSDLHLGSQTGSNYSYLMLAQWLHQKNTTASIHSQVKRHAPTCQVSQCHHRFHWGARQSWQAGGWRLRDGNSCRNSSRLGMQLPCSLGPIGTFFCDGVSLLHLPDFVSDGWAPTWLVFSAATALFRSATSWGFGHLDLESPETKWNIWNWNSHRHHFLFGNCFRLLGCFIWLYICKFKFLCFGCRNETGSFICFPHVHIFHFFQLRIFSVNMCNFIFCCKLCKLGCDPDGPARIMTLNWTLASGSWC